MSNIQIEQSQTRPPIPAEEWRDVVGFEAYYEVSSHGHVRRKETGRILRTWIAGYGYFQVALCDASRKRKVAVHVLVAEAFHGPRPSPRHEVAHWDGSATHNSPENLRWATHIENVHDQQRHGTLRTPVLHGSLHPRAKLTDQDVSRIRQAYCGRRGQLTELAVVYGVHPSTVKRAAVGAGWGQL